jgi:hypothetical protein
MAAMPLWLYAATCVIVPQLWALGVARVCRRWDRPPPSVHPDFNI